MTTRAILYRTDTGEILDSAEPGHRWDASRVHPQATVAQVEVGQITAAMLLGGLLRFRAGELIYERREGCK